MSAADPEAAAEIADQFPITPEEAEAIADAMAPLQDMTSAGASFGTAIERAPGSGTSLLGVTLRNVAAHADLLTVSAETLARVVQFYIDSQIEGAPALFPPPSMAVEQFRADVRPLVDMIQFARSEAVPQVGQ